MSCSICLSRFKEPVSVPCGHVYCTECLTHHVTATSSDGFTSTCPSCREPFNMVRPELTCLPKKFHQYILPSVRRVYVESSPSSASLRKKVASAEAQIRVLEADKERLINQCDRHIAVARAHNVAETNALLRERLLEEEIEQMRNHAGIEANEAQAALKALKVKYDKLKRHCRSLEKDGTRNETLPSFNVSKRNNSSIDMSVNDAEGSTPKRLRIIRPLPNRGGRLSLLITPTKTGLELGSPFRT
ncbi:hypothetical protein C8F01DRAFT_981902 [Mycena amicta]|nr:hypothetical protein C8F01DRAFT_981902 [Mycena amicta]